MTRALQWHLMIALSIVWTDVMLLIIFTSPHSRLGGWWPLCFYWNTGYSVSWLQPIMVSLTATMRLCPCSTICGPHSHAWGIAEHVTALHTQYLQHPGLSTGTAEMQTVWRNSVCIYRQISYIRCTLLGNRIVDHSDAVGASPVGAAPTTSSFST